MTGPLLRRRRWPTGFWTGPGMAKHRCVLPKVRVSDLPPGTLAFRCECGSEWRFQWLSRG